MQLIYVITCCCLYMPTSHSPSTGVSNASHVHLKPFSQVYRILIFYFLSQGSTQGHVIQQILKSIQCPRLPTDHDLTDLTPCMAAVQCEDCYLQASVQTQLTTHHSNENRILCIENSYLVYSICSFSL